MIIKWSITIPELSGSQLRNAYIYLPDLCEEDPSVRLPVLYMFDGHNLFYDEDATYGKSWGLEAYMDETRTPVIIAAVECSHSPSNGRLSEYSPFTFYDHQFGHVTGRGRRTMEWLIHKFKPEIDRHFPTLPDRAHTMIAGSSMGGLMSLYAVLEYNRVFSRAAALSPSLWVDPGKLESMIRASCPASDTVLYMDYGAQELGGHAAMLRHLGRTAGLLLEKKLHLSFRIIPNGEHCEASWERQIPFFMNTLLYELD